MLHRSHRSHYNDEKANPQEAMMLREVLIYTLRPVHRTAGLYLQEDEDFFYLKREGQDKPLAVWLAYTVTIAMIHDAADSILERGE